MPVFTLPITAILEISQSLLLVMNVILGMLLIRNAFRKIKSLITKK